MNLLAIDTATEACSAALHAAGVWRSEYEEMPRGHTKALMPMVHRLLADAGLALSDLDGIAVGRGPGALTGVRIGVSMAQGLAVGAGIRIAPVSNLAAMALQTYQQHAAATVSVAIDARAGGLYHGLYACAAGQVELLGAESVRGPHDPVVVRGDVWTAGTGWDTYADALTAAHGDAAVHRGQVRLPTALAIGQLGLQCFEAGGAVPPERVEPEYLRNSVTG